MEAVAHGSLRAASLFSVAGRVALITGGGRGVGEMIARALVENGATVYIASRSEGACARTAKVLSALGPGVCHALPAADLSTDAGCQEMVAQLSQREHGLDILVNNSGISWGAPLETFPEEQWDRVMALNVKSPFLVTRACKPLLLAASAAAAAAAAPPPSAGSAAAEGDAAAGARPRGDTTTLLGAGPSRVINIGSIVGLRPQPIPTYSYDASKAALHALTLKLAGELAPAITVNAIALGYVPSRMSRGLLNYGRAEQLEAAIPMKRFGSAGDVGGAALFLSSRAGQWVTGTVLTVDGGSVGAQPLVLVSEGEELA
jgi:NAD(P)-dependent dehydrogenase (short-subunit alcohol dehydrogenase family)